MKIALQKLSNKITVLNRLAGRLAAVLVLVLIVLIVLDVCLRYVFGWSTPMMFELEWHVFASIFLLGGAYALAEDEHVRVDIFYQRFSGKQRAWLNFLGVLFFLFPFCFVLFYNGIKMTHFALLCNEGSPDPGGLGFRAGIKAMLPLSALLLFLQGFALLVESFLTIKKQ